MLLFALVIFNKMLQLSMHERTEKFILDVIFISSTKFHLHRTIYPCWPPSLSMSLPINHHCPPCPYPPPAAPCTLLAAHGLYTRSYKGCCSPCLPPLLLVLFVADDDVPQHSLDVDTLPPLPMTCFGSLMTAAVMLYLLPFIKHRSSTCEKASNLRVNVCQLKSLASVHENHQWASW